MRDARSTPEHSGADWCKADAVRTSVATLAVGGLLLVGALVFAAGLAATGDGDPAPAASTVKKPTTTKSTDLEFEAFEICKDFVKRRLKAPSTAKFRNFFEEDGEVRVTGSGNGPYTVMSTVDAQNAFGAPLRNNFICTVTLSGSTWMLDDISII